MKRIIFFAMALVSTAVIPAENKLVVYTNSGKHQISKYIYGHFAEHLGRCIYDGIWVGQDSKIPNINGYRKDVMEALKALEIPVLRWPGGCFADTYHWMDGIGPRENRPKIKNVFWGGVIEDNSFGTHEFLNLCEMLGCDAYISANVGSGTVEEMADWIEYMISDEDVPMANLRKAHGRTNPWNVKFLGIGNESWGCGGNMTPEYYADLMKQYSTYVYQYGGSKMIRVGCGASDLNLNWTKVLMKKAAYHMDALSLHYYTIAGEGWSNKSAATGFDEALYFSGLHKALRMDEIVTRHSTIMDEFDIKNRVGLYVDEWGIWTDVEPGTEPGFLFQQNSMRDALIASLTLDILNKHCERVKMANIAQIVNVLQAMILTQGDQMILTPTYHVFNLYKGHKDAILLPAKLTCEDYTLNDQHISAISSTVSLQDDGSLFATISNVNPEKSITLDIDLIGKKIKKISNASVLTAPKFNSVNLFDDSDIVKPVEFKNYKMVNDHILRIEIPSKSVLALEIIEK